MFTYPGWLHFERLDGEPTVATLTSATIGIGLYMYRSGDALDRRREKLLDQARRYSDSPPSRQAAQARTIGGLACAQERIQVQVGRCSVHHTLTEVPWLHGWGTQVLDAHFVELPGLSSKAMFEQLTETLWSSMLLDGS